MSFSYKYKSFAEALYHALAEDAFYITMEESVEHLNSPKEAMFRYMEYSMIEAHDYGLLFLPEDHEHGASIWCRPVTAEIENQKQQRKERFICEEMGENSLETYKEIVEFMSSQSTSIVNGNSWYLSIVGLMPEFQGKGLGAGLIEDVLKKTDSIGVETYLETFTPKNMSFYERLGFEIADSFHEPTTNARYWIMIRKPQYGAENEEL